MFEVLECYKEEETLPQTSIGTTSVALSETVPIRPKEFKALISKRDYVLPKAFRSLDLVAGKRHLLQTLVS